jgi:lambda family phage minor tail protein L
MTIPSSDLLTLTPDAIIDLYLLDLNSIGTNFTFYFCNWETTGGNLITFQGIAYTPLSIEVSGMELTSKGNPQPNITISNIFGIITSLAIQYDDLIGATFKRKRTLRKYLDDGSSANPIMEFPEESYSLWRKSNENALTITYELKQSSDLGFKSKIPLRIIRKYNCEWKYRGLECGYTGGAIADQNDISTSDLTKDSCGKRLASCKMRFGSQNQLPFGAFPGVDIV